MRPFPRWEAPNPVSPGDNSVNKLCGKEKFCGNTAESPAAKGELQLASERVLYGREDSVNLRNTALEIQKKKNSRRSVIWARGQCHIESGNWGNTETYREIQSNYC